MQVTINSDNTATITVNRNELCTLDYSLGYYVAHARNQHADDISLADALEQQLWTQYCKLVDQIQDQSCASQEAHDLLWDNAR